MSKKKKTGTSKYEYNVYMPTTGFYNPNGCEIIVIEEECFGKRTTTDGKTEWFGAKSGYHKV